ncbi:MAG TPA: ATP-binding cassette domain-containing protein [Elusimicrobiota bacterium]|nr:ATP-binding cassette domain-containing protein [Elusimicrobiota bacterium]
MSLLEIQHLSKSFAIEGGIFRRTIGAVQAVQNVSFHIDPGETLALVGGSGCGKSTIAKLIAGLVIPDAGTLLWNGQSMMGWNRRERARHIQMIFQDPFASLNPKLSVGMQLEEGVKLGWGIAGPAHESPKTESIRLLEMAGLSADAMHHYPFQFSGGQRQRIAIARALALRPPLLIADEPLSALDVSVQAQILALFKELKASLNLTLLFITHDLVVASTQADRVVVLQDGRIVEEGQPDDALEHPRHPYTRALVEAVPPIPV